MKTEENTLRILVENVLRHLTFTNLTDSTGKPYMEVTMQIDSRIVFSRVIPGKPSSRDTLPFDLIALNQYIKNPDDKGVKEIVKHRMGRAEMQKGNK